MQWTAIQLNHFRNFERLSIKPHPRATLIHGPNGVGKTALLEAIYFLAHGRSFKTQMISRLVQHQQPALTLYGEYQQAIHHKVGTTRSRQGVAKTRWNGKTINAHSEITRQCPVILIHPESIALLTRGAQYRRQWLDWGCFYHYPDFYGLWQYLRRALKQRNAALKQQLASSQITLWDSVITEVSKKIDQCRRQYLEGLLPIVNDVLDDFLTKTHLTIQYYGGWPESESLESVLARSLTTDQKSGYTHYGPHKADIRFRINHMPAQDILSRGQQKLLVNVLKLAQGQYYQQCFSMPATYLLDDLASELDSKALTILSEKLHSLKAQSFLTAVDLQQISPFFKDFDALALS